MIARRTILTLSFPLLMGGVPVTAQESPGRTLSQLQEMIRLYGHHAGLGGSPSKYRLLFDPGSPCVVTIEEQYTQGDGAISILSLQVHLADTGEAPASASRLEILAKPGGAPLQSEYTWIKTNGETLRGGLDSRESLDVYLQAADGDTARRVVATFNQARRLCAPQQPPAGGAGTNQLVRRQPTPSELAERAHREWLDPVLQELRRRVTANRRVTEILSNVELRTITTPMPEWGPTPVATFDKSTGRPVVYVDLVFLNELFDVADLGGLAMTGRDETALILQRAGATYANDLKQAAGRGAPPPPMRFKLETAVLEPGLRVMAQRLSSEVFSAGVAWALLHEVAHHVRHFDHEPPKTKSGQRDLELDADVWAFGMMQELGYGLAPLQATLGALEVGEHLRLMAGQAIAEAASDHPSWTRRRQELMARHDVTRPPKGTFLVVLTVRGEDPRRLVVEETWIPRDPDSEGYLYALFKHGEQPVQRLPFEWTGGEIHLYGRDTTTFDEIIIHDPENLRPRVTISHIPVLGGPRQESTTRGFQVSLAPLVGLQVGRLLASDIVATSPRAVMAGALVAAGGIDAATRGTVQNAQMNLLRETRRLLIRYAKGELSLQEATSQFTIRRNGTRAQLEATLGAGRFAQFERALLSNQVVEFGLQQLGPSVR